MKRWQVLGFGLGIVLLLVLTAGSTVLGESKAKPTATVDAVSGKSKGDYLPAHNFKIEIDGVITAGFTEVSGLDTQIEVIEYQDGTDPVTHKRAGKAKYRNITMKVNPSSPAAQTLAAWFNDTSSGKEVRKSISVILYGDNDEPVARYNLFEAWPCRWKAPELNSHSDTYIMEEIEFVVEKVERA